MIRVCDLFDRPLVISFWFTRGGDCLPSQDSFNEVAERYGDEVNFLSINVRDEREEVRRDRPRTRLADAGRLRRRRRRRQPLPGRRLPDARRSPTRAASSPAGVVGEENFTPEALGKRVDKLIAESEKRESTDR